MTEKKFDVNDKETLSYILGVLLGDGSAYIEKRGDEPKHSSGRICLSQTKKEFADSFKSALEKIWLNPCYYQRSRFHNRPFWSGTTHYYEVRARSLPFVKWYQSLTLDEIKQIVIENPKNAKEFIRGFYESEGSNEMYAPKHIWKIRFINSNKKLLELVKEILGELGFGEFKIRTRKNHFSRFGTKPIFTLENNYKNQNHRFIKEINPCIKKQVWGDRFGGYC